VRVGLGVRVRVGPGVRLGEGVWVEVGAKVEVEMMVALGATGAGVAWTQPAAAMGKSAISTACFKRSRPGCRSRGGSNQRSPNPAPADPERCVSLAGRTRVVP
jgi:hypothetical protein